MVTTNFSPFSPLVQSSCIVAEFPNQPTPFLKSDLHTWLPTTWFSFTYKVSPWWMPTHFKIFHLWECCLTCLGRVEYLREQTSTWRQTSVDMSHSWRLLHHPLEWVSQQSYLLPTVEQWFCASSISLREWLSNLAPNTGNHQGQKAMGLHIQSAKRKRLSTKSPIFGKTILQKWRRNYNIPR